MVEPGMKRIRLVQSVFPLYLVERVISFNVELTVLN